MPFECFNVMAPEFKTEVYMHAVQLRILNGSVSCMADGDFCARVQVRRRLSPV